MMRSTVDAKDSAACVCIDLSCECCGYNLRTCSTTGNCPECGRAVALTLHRTGMISARERLVAISIPVTGFAPMLCMHILDLGVDSAEGMFLGASITNFVAAVVIFRWRRRRYDPDVRGTLFWLIVAAAFCTLFNGLFATGIPTA